MIILDTNVVSEPMKPSGEPRVLAWLDEQIAETLFLTSVNLAELLAGIEMLPDGKRKQHLKISLSSLISRLFGSRILPFDEKAAKAYAAITSRAQMVGRQISMADGQIAAIASVHGFAVATRDLEPFEAAGTTIINPWTV